MPSSRKTELYELYWKDYFDALDECAPHEQGALADNYSRWRSVTTYTCPDGVLFHFDDGDELTFVHKTSTKKMKALFMDILAPLSFDFDVEYPYDTDFGPFHMGYAKAGQKTEPQVYLKRVHLAGGPANQLTPERAKEIATGTIRGRPATPPT